MGNTCGFNPTSFPKKETPHRAVKWDSSFPAARFLLLSAASKEPEALLLQGAAVKEAAGGSPRLHTLLATAPGHSGWHLLKAAPASLPRGVSRADGTNGPTLPLPPTHFPGEAASN